MNFNCAQNQNGTVTQCIPRGIKFLNLLSKKESLHKRGGEHGSGIAERVARAASIPQRWFIIPC